MAQDTLHKAQGTRYTAQRQLDSAAAELYYAEALGHYSEPFEGNTYCVYTV